MKKRFIDFTTKDLEDIKKYCKNIHNKFNNVYNPCSCCNYSLYYKTLRDGSKEKYCIFSTEVDLVEVEV